MKRVSAYQATDGSLFDDKKACAAHQHTLNVQTGITAIANTFSGNDELNNQVARFIAHNEYKLRLALAGKEVSVATVSPAPVDVELENLLGEVATMGEAPILADGTTDTTALDYPETSKLAA